jgi:hypothetical protein
MACPGSLLHRRLCAELRNYLSVLGRTAASPILGIVREVLDLVVYRPSPCSPLLRWPLVDGMAYFQITHNPPSGAGWRRIPPFSLSLSNLSWVGLD